MHPCTCTFAEAVALFRAGQPVVLKDDPDREDEGDLILPAEAVTPEAINMMLREARGLLTVPMEQARLEALEIPLIPPRNANETCPRFTVPVDAVCIHSTGISAADRAATILELVRADARPEDFLIPGHVFPLAGHPLGLAGRQGHTEGALALVRAAGLFPAVAMCEILREDGEMAKGADLERFAGRFGLRIILIGEIIRAVGDAPTG